MNICLYKDGAPAGTIDLPEPVYTACLTLDRWLSEQDSDCTVYGLGRASHRDVRIAELEKIAAGVEDVKAMLFTKNQIIAELEKQAAIDKALLALADARINRELRDDFAGLALAGTVPKFKYPQNIAEEAYAIADAMLKVKGGA